VRKKLVRKGIDKDVYATDPNSSQNRQRKLPLSLRQFHVCLLRSNRVQGKKQPNVHFQTVEENENLRLHSFIAKFVLRYIYMYLI